MSRWIADKGSYTVQTQTLFPSINELLPFLSHVSISYDSALHSMCVYFPFGHMILLGKRIHFKPSHCKLTLCKKYLKGKLIATLLVKKFVVVYET